MTYRCTAINKNGARCCRSCPKGELVCSVHLLHAKGKSQADHLPFVAPDTETLYRRLMADKDSRVRLRALDGYQRYLERQEKKCPTCAPQVEAQKVEEVWVNQLTDDERDTLRLLGQEFQGFKAATRYPNMAEPPLLATSEDTP